MSRLTKGAVLGLAIAGLAAIQTANAEDLMDMGAGTEVTGVARLGGVQIPLPGGKWEVALSTTDRVGDQPAENVFLVQKTSSGRLAAYLFARANSAPYSGYGLKRPPWCERNNVHHNGSDNYYNPSDADCWIVNHWVVTNRVSSLDIVEQIKDWLRKHHATSTVVGSRYWRNDSTDYVLITHAVNPAVWGFPHERRSWIASAWNAKSIIDGTPRQKFIAAVKAFGAKYREAVRNGFRNRLAGASVPSFAFDTR